MTALRKTLGFNNCLQLIRRFSNERPHYEVSIPVPWGKIRGKWWGPTDIRPILTVHGWQDNCGTFDRLIPLLNKNISFLAIDLPGHGCSSWLPPGLYYHFTTYLLTLKFIVKYFQWPKVSLMGHSMGGLSSYTYTMLYPDNVDFVACIDGFKPFIINNCVQTMSKSIDKFLRINEFDSSSDYEPPSYSIEEIKKKIHASNNGSIYEDYASYIMKRNITHSKLNPRKYYFTRDPRLALGELLSFSQKELVEQAHKLTCPIFISKSKIGSYWEPKENFYGVLDVLKRSSKDCDFHYVEGTHHALLNNPEELAGLLQQFIQRHNTEKRSMGGLKDEMLVNEREYSQINVTS